MQTLDQRRADHAWKALREFLKWTDSPSGNRDEEKEKEAARKKYGVHARKLPMRVMASGLGQSLAFLHAKRHRPALLYALSDWHLYKRQGSADAAREPNELLLAVVSGDAEFAQQATAETLAYLRWLTRFVEAEKLAAERVAAVAPPTNRSRPPHGRR